MRFNKNHIYSAIIFIILAFILTPIVAVFAIWFLHYRKTLAKQKREADREATRLMVERIEAVKREAAKREAAKREEAEKRKIDDV